MRAQQFPFIALTLAGLLFAVTCYILGDPPVYGDGVMYAGLSVNIAQNGVLAHRNGATPYAFPFLIAQWVSLVGPDRDALHIPMFATNLVVHVVACLLIARRLGTVFESRAFAVTAYAVAALNPFLLIAAGEFLRESLSASTIGLSLVMALGSDDPDEHRGVVGRMWLSMLMAGLATMLRPTSLPIPVAVGIIWVARWIVFRDVPWRAWIAGAIGLALPFVPQILANWTQYGVINPLVVGSGLYSTVAVWAVTIFKFGGVVVPGGVSGLPYLNPLVPPGIVEPADFLRVAPLGYLATVGLHIFALVDVDFPFVYIRDLDPWYRWPLSFLNYAYLWLGLAGVWIGVQHLRRRTMLRRAFAVLAGIFAAGAYAAAFALVIAESRYGVPIFMLLVPAVTWALLRGWAAIRAGRWRRLLVPLVTLATFIAGCSVLSAWMQEQAPLLHERPRVARIMLPLLVDIAVDPPTVWSPGETRTYEAQLKNLGYFPWIAQGTNRVALGIHFGSLQALREPQWLQDQLFGLPASQAAGEMQRVTVQVVAPSSPGCYYLIHRVIAEGWTWFGEPAYVPVLVGELPPGQPAVDRVTGKPPCEPPPAVPPGR